MSPSNYYYNGGRIGNSTTGQPTIIQGKEGAHDTEVGRHLGDAIYPFSSFIFTAPEYGPFAPRAGDVMANPPSHGITQVVLSDYQAQWGSHYGLYFSDNGGVQQMVIPKDGRYRILCAGAASWPRTAGYNTTYFNGYNGGGAVLEAEYEFFAGEILYIIPGKRPYGSGQTRNWAGGAGGSFVAVSSNNGVSLDGQGPRINTPIVQTTPRDLGGSGFQLLLVAGGGAQTNISTYASVGSATYYAICGQMGIHGGASASGGNQGFDGLAAAPGYQNSNSNGAGASGAFQNGTDHGDLRNYYAPSSGFWYQFYYTATRSTHYPGAKGLFTHTYQELNNNPTPYWGLLQGGIFNTGYDGIYRGSGGFGGGGAGGWLGIGGGGGFSGGGSTNGNYAGGGGSYISNVRNVSNVKTSTGAWSGQWVNPFQQGTLPTDVYNARLDHYYNTFTGTPVGTVNEPITGQPFNYGYNGIIQVTRL